MSVVKSKRKESKFEVFHHFYKMRKEITDLLLRDFGYSVKKSEAHLEKMFGGKPFHELDDNEKEHYHKRHARNEAFEQWFIGYQRDTIMEQASKGKHG